MEGIPSREPRGVRVLFADQALAVAEVGNVCVALWRGAVTRAPFDRQRSGLAEVVGRHPEGVAFLCVVEITAKPPEEAELRRASAEMVGEHGDRVKCVACVVEGDGFRNAINRGAITGMVLLYRGKKPPVSVFAKVADASRWMAEHLTIPAASDVIAAVDFVRQRTSASLPSR